LKSSVVGGDTRNLERWIHSSSLELSPTHEAGAGDPHGSARERASDGCRQTALSWAGHSKGTLQLFRARRRYECPWLSPLAVRSTVGPRQRADNSPSRLRKFRMIVVGSPQPNVIPPPPLRNAYRESVKPATMALLRQGSREAGIPGARGGGLPIPPGKQSPFSHSTGAHRTAIAFAAHNSEVYSPRVTFQFSTSAIGIYSGRSQYKETASAEPASLSRRPEYAVANGLCHCDIRIGVSWGCSNRLSSSSPNRVTPATEVRGFDQKSVPQSRNGCRGRFSPPWLL